MGEADSQTRLADRLALSRAGSLERLYRQYAPWLAARLRRRYGDQADDLLQETYMRVARSAAAGGIVHPKALLLKVASNVAINAAVSRSRRDARESDFCYLESRTAMSGDQEQMVLLRQLIHSMPTKFRHVFLLSRFGGLGYSEIADRLNLPLKTVEWRMSKALAHCASLTRD